MELGGYASAVEYLRSICEVLCLSLTLQTEWNILKKTYYAFVYLLESIKNYLLGQRV